jgi:hypothetical protein
MQNAQAWWQVVNGEGYDTSATAVWCVLSAFVLYPRQDIEPASAAILSKFHMFPGIAVD